WPFYEYLSERFGPLFIMNVFAAAQSAGGDGLTGIQNALTAKGTTLVADSDAVVRHQPSFEQVRTDRPRRRFRCQRLLRRDADTESQDSERRYIEADVLLGRGRQRSGDLRDRGKHRHGDGSVGHVLVADERLSRAAELESHRRHQLRPLRNAGGRLYDA